MSDEKIVVVIDEDGGIIAETSGFQGKACIETLAKLLDGLGDETGRKNKDEYYEGRASSVGIIQRGSR
ncbi:MAG: DUF2997 domain-containing protein [Spirochaetaceae bacterium]|nr:DUF2997 domain-containing protein [Spirochaetaceae bacterium]